MTLHFHYQPLSSYWWKVRIALAESEIPFTASPVDMSDADAVARFRQLSPLGKFPVMEDSLAGVTMYEANQMLDYVDHWHPGPISPVTGNRDLDREIGFRDRFFESYLHVPLIRLVAARSRSDKADGETEHASMRELLANAYDVLERDLDGREWVAGESFSLADCGAAPMLVFANTHEPIGDARPRLAAYFARLRARPSVRQLLDEVRPFLTYYPASDEERARLIAAAA